MFGKKFWLQLEYTSSTLVGHSGMDLSDHFLFQRFNCVDIVNPSPKNLSTNHLPVAFIEEPITCIRL